MEVFKNKDIEYEAWCDKHPQGYMFNHYGSTIPDFNVIHTTKCHTLWRKSDNGVRTRIEKICCEDYSQLLEKVCALREESWKICKACLPQRG